MLFFLTKQSLKNENRCASCRVLLNGEAAGKCLRDSSNFAVNAQEDPPASYIEERDALYALKATFNDPTLNDQWTGLHCEISGTSLWIGIQCIGGRVTGISLENRGLAGEISVNAFTKFTELSILSFKNNSLRGNVMDFSNNQKMKSIVLSDNMFWGPISLSLVSLGFLETLLLQDNALTGTIPEFNQSSLKNFNVSNNNLHGQIPNTTTLQSFPAASYGGNPLLCGSPLPNSCTKNTHGPDQKPAQQNYNDGDSKKGSSNTIYMLLTIVLLIAVIVLFILYYMKDKKLKKVMKEKRIPIRMEEEVKEEKKVEVEERSTVVAAAAERGSLKFIEEEGIKFEMGDLLKASAEALGTGIFGNSYKAMLNGGSSIVVKRLRDLKPMTDEEFNKQLRLLSDLKHPNLLPLLAYYNTKDEKLLLYKYAEYGSLFFRLHGGRGSKDRVPFKWNSRLSIARGVARALEYLHLNIKSQIIIPHGNLKPSNVLIDENDMVLVSDYALTYLVALPIAAQRMIAFKSPEFQHSRRITKQTDIWSYGCLVLELLTGKLSAYSAPPGINGVDLVSWVNRAVREEWTAEIFDPEISAHKNASPGLVRLMQIAMRCCDMSPEKRPEIREVVREVENIRYREGEDDQSSDVSMDRSLTDDSLSTSASINIGDDRCEF